MQVQSVAGAQFSSNILYGSKTMYSYEMVRGYTLSVSGSGMVPISATIIEVHMEMSEGWSECFGANPRRFETSRYLGRMEDN